MKIMRLILAGGLALSLVACAEGPNKQVWGGAIGTVAGILIGSTIGSGTTRSIAIISGGLIGNLVGQSIGAKLDARDEAALYAATEEALDDYDDGETAYWENTETGTMGSVTPTNTYAGTQSQTCRNFNQSVTVDQNETTYGGGKACRQADGSWKII